MCDHLLEMTNGICSIQYCFSATSNITTTTSKSQVDDGGSNTVSNNEIDNMVQSFCKEKLEKDMERLDHVVNFII
jgi:hypothetical protein